MCPFYPVTMIIMRNAENNTNTNNTTLVVGRSLKRNNTFTIDSRVYLGSHMETSRWNFSYYTRDGFGGGVQGEGEMQTPIALVRRDEKRI